MKFIFLLVLFLLNSIYSFKFNNNLNLKLRNNINLNLDKNNKNLYKTYLNEKRKTIKFINNITNSNTKTLSKLIDKSFQILEYNKDIYINNTKSKYKTIVIDDNIKINIKNVKNIKIYNNNDYNINLYNNNSYDINNDIYNDIDLIYEKIKELDILLNLLNLLLFFQN